MEIRTPAEIVDLEAEAARPIRELPIIQDF